jgi:acyl carrier protein
LQYLEDSASVDLADIDDNTELFSSGLVDSFAMVDLLVFLEKHTGAKLGPEDISLENFDSVERILAFAAAHQRA